MFDKDKNYISIIKWNSISLKNEPPKGDTLLVYVKDDSGDTVNYYIQTAWLTRSNDWISDNDHLYGEVLAWAYMPNSSDIVSMPNSRDIVCIYVNEK